MLHESPLAHSNTVYPREYAPGVLFPVPRRLGRDALGLREDALPFDGVDIWNAYELSWLNPAGKPEVAVAELRVPVRSASLVESKSLKLYLNSLSYRRFASPRDVEAAVAADVARVVGAPVQVRLTMRAGFEERVGDFPGYCIDDQDVTCDRYDVAPEFLRHQQGAMVEETLFSNLLRSNCPVTGQPDSASVLIRYRGPRIDAAGLLRYIISFREHTGFHEQCVEHMFRDLQARCACEQLTVYARYTRRGGIDINPFRSNWEKPPINRRLYRQ